jgi:hypothetical protein
LPLTIIALAKVHCAAVPIRSQRDKSTIQDNLELHQNADRQNDNRQNDNCQNDDRQNDNCQNDDRQNDDRQNDDRQNADLQNGNFQSVTVKMSTSLTYILHNVS